MRVLSICRTAIPELRFTWLRRGRKIEARRRRVLPQEQNDAGAGRQIDKANKLFT